MRDLSSLTKDWTHVPCSESAVLTTGLPAKSPTSAIVIHSLQIKKGKLGEPGNLPNPTEPVRGRSESLTSIHHNLKPVFSLTLRLGRGPARGRLKGFCGGVISFLCVLRSGPQKAGSQLTLISNWVVSFLNIWLRKKHLPSSFLK